MDYPAEVFFDIETLINVAQPERVLLLGDCDASFLDEFIAQKSVLNQDCQIEHISAENIAGIQNLTERYDVGIVVGLFEHVSKQQGMQILSRLRDVLTSQYCICLPLADRPGTENWHLTDLFSFALNQVASYGPDDARLGLFKYNISDYKKTPDWLNSDNWANPEMWGKYRW